MKQGFAFFCLVFVLLSSIGFAQQKPNIIFILTDDHRADALGVMGNKYIQTPNLDALAKKGVLYKNAYVTTSICCVSRASILSGEYKSRHGVNDFKTDFSPEALKNTYPILLKDAGYKIGFVGKYGVGNNHPKQLFDYWSCTPKEQPDYILTNGAGKKIHNTDSVGNDITKFLDLYGTKGPFCLSVGFKAPHEQDGTPPRFITQERFKDLYNNITIPEPETADPKYWNSFPDFFRTDQNVARIRWKPLFSTPELYQQTVKDYYRLISGVDEIVGNMVTKLKKMGLDKNTVIIFMGDNGFYLGEHGLEGKWYMHEESIRVPLIVYDPRQPDTKNGKVNAQIALNIDIAPTILQLAGVKAPVQMQGKSLAYNTVVKPERSSFFYEHTYSKGPKIPQSEGIVSLGLKYTKYIENGYEELYDIKIDPREKNNLVFDKKYAVALAALRKQYEAQKAAVK